MIRVKIVKPNQKYRIGDTIEVSKNEAFGLLDSGVAVMSKDIVSTDHINKGVKPKRRK